MSCYEKRTFECMTKSSFLFKKYLQQCYMFNEFTFYGNVAVQVLVQLVSQLSANLRCRNKRPGWPPFSHWPLERPATIFQLDRDPQESWIRETSKEILHLKFTFIFIAHVFMPKQTLWPFKKVINLVLLFLHKQKFYRRLPRWSVLNERQPIGRRAARQRT